VRLLQTREDEAVSLIEHLKRRPGSISGVWRGSKCDSLASGPSLVVQEEDPLKPDIEVLSQWAFAQHDHQGAVCEFLGLLFRIGHHRDVRIAYTRSNGLSDTVFVDLTAYLEVFTLLGPVIEAHGGVWVELSGRNGGCKLGLGPSLAYGDSSALESAPAVVLKGVKAEKYLRLLVIEAIIAPSDVSRPVNERILHPEG
jgi:hypothetical protein